MDIHTKLMKNYQDIPSWWFYILLSVTLFVALMLCIFLKDEVQMPVWALLAAALLAFIFTLPISIITATTNQVYIYIHILKNPYKICIIKLWKLTRWLYLMNRLQD